MWGNDSYARPRYKLTIPNVSGFATVSVNPTASMLPRKSCPSGKASTDSGRYV